MLRNCIVALLLSFVSGMSFSLTGYQIEVVIFSHLNQSGFNAEEWPSKTSSVSIPNNAVSLKTTKANANLYPVTPSQFMLTDVVKRLAANPNYKILLHTGWVESLSQLDKTTTIQLAGGDHYGSGLDETRGKVTVKMQRYFDVNFNLLFAIPNNKLHQLTNNKQYTDQPIVFIPLKEQRRTKSKELNYIDHPLYGVLFRITPV